MSKNNETGFVETSLLVMLAIGIGLLAFVIWLGYKQVAQIRKYNAWIADCRAAGGVVKESFQISQSSAWYDCYVKGKVVVLPGWESEERDKPYTPSQ